MRIVACLALLSLGVLMNAAEVKTEKVEYKHGDTVCEGVLAWPADLKDKAPGVAVVHDWKGIGEETIRRTKMVAELGFVAFALDVYGKDARPKGSEDAGKYSGKFKNDRMLMRERLKAGLDVLAGHEKVDATRLAAIGYCFGGTCVLEMARAGFDLDGVVSFHGGLDTPTPEDAVNIKGKVLVLHGADDPGVPPDEVLDFQKEMRDAKVDWYMVSYGNAVHSFTNPEANSERARYNEKADKRSWRAMQDFFGEIFAK